MSAPEDNAPDVPRDDPLIAAEWALGLLEGEELLAARGKYASDPGFAWRKDWWDNWFAPLTDEIAGARPGDHVWAAIAARVAAQQGAASTTHSAAVPGETVVALRAQVRRWQWAAALSSAAAAVALAVLVFAPARAPVEAPARTAAAAPMVATVPIGESGLRLDVTYIPASETMLVAAIGLTADGVHDHELWLVPGNGGALQSLGVIAPGEVRAVALPQAVSAQLDDRASLVLTREPIGGKPAGRDAGPVVAEGAFTRV
jgi:anti-sigma-K factor RskA